MKFTSVISLVAAALAGVSALPVPDQAAIDSAALAQQSAAMQSLIEVAQNQARLASADAEKAIQSLLSAAGLATAANPTSVPAAHERAAVATKTVFEEAKPKKADPRTVVVTAVVTATAGAPAPAPVATTIAAKDNKNVVIVTEVVTAIATATAGAPAPAPATTEAPAPAPAPAPATTGAPAPVTTSEAPAPATTEAAPAPTSAAPAAPSTTEAPAPSTTEAPAPSPSTPAKETPIAHEPAPTSSSSSAAAQPTTSNPASNSSAFTGSFAGDGTYYTPGLGSCGLTNTDSDLIAAINAPQYGTNANPNNAPICGQCALVKGPKGQVKVKITDRCPVCKHGDLDLSPSAFEKVGDFDAGRIQISWSFVAC